MLHEGDYDDEEHRDELELMLGVLETATDFAEVEACPEYLWFLKRLEPRLSARVRRRRDALHQCGRGGSHAA